jgi:hypothetical protein
MDFNLPAQSFVNKFIPKNKIFGKVILNTKIRNEFTDKIQKITWKYKLSEETININKTDNIEEIQIFEIELKEQIIPKNILKIIDKIIPYPILYIFTYKNEFAYGISLKDENAQNYVKNYKLPKVNDKRSGVPNTRFPYSSVNTYEIWYDC